MYYTFFIREIAKIIEKARGGKGNMKILEEIVMKSENGIFSFLSRNKKRYATIKRKTVDVFSDKTIVITSIKKNTKNENFVK